MAKLSHIRAPKLWRRRNRFHTTPLTEELTDRSPKSWILSLQMGRSFCVTRLARLQIPHSRTVEETRNDAVLADLEDRAEAAGDECGGGAGTFGHGGSRSESGPEGMGVMPEDRANKDGVPWGGLIKQQPNRRLRHPR